MNNKVGLIQMVSSSNIRNNLKQVELLMLEAHQQQTQLVVLPENFAFMGMNEQDKIAIAEVYGQGPIQERIKQLAKQLKLWVVAGTIAIKGSGSKVRASSIVFDDQGLSVARYDKLHLFDVRISEHEAHKESATIERGTELV
ncbi:MAG: carbon-nitrogen hydrolase family protein, partial [bacterium]|nr:carbon-nitrogen hydrolase family protein [bacterium]